MTSTTTPTSRDAADSLFSARHLPTVVASVGLVTLGAYENRAVMTVLPTVAADLHALPWYGLLSVASMVTYLVSTTVSGGWADRFGPRRLLVVGLVTFVVAQLVTGTAASTAQVLVGRVLSGSTEGALDIGLVVLIARTIPERLRPTVFATFATAWILPSILGPVVAGAVAEQWGWRAVFLTPLVVLAPAVVALVPALLRVSPPAVGAPSPVSESAKVRAACIVAASVAVLTWAGASVTTHPVPAACGLLAGLVGVAAGLRHVLPPGAVRLARGIPAVVSVGMLTSAAFTSEGAFLPLMLSAVQHTSPRVTGVSLAVTGCFWAVGSNVVSRAWVQDRYSPAVRARAGLVLMALGAAGPALLAVDRIGLVAGMAGWALSSTGMGMTTNTLTVHLINLAGPDGAGRANAAATLAASVGGSLAVALGGAVVSANASHLTGSAFAAVIMTSALVAAAAAVLAVRVESPGVRD